uniref:Xylulose kinase-1 n=1 Tax=Tanacetum cinerariifolium TaxID=118510 RepID=A0A6L2L517_TANCI|nr:hypothetical protein [Tanacetum cinerariifolium]
MTNLTFADTHNMTAFLSKSDASPGFDQIVDFLNAQVIQYALMVNPTIYVSCIKQFWATVSIKKVNDVVKLRVLINGKRVVVTEDVIRHDLRLDDTDGVECLPNEEIFTELTRMGYEKPPPKLTFYKAFFSAQWKFLIHTLVQCISAKRTAWNKFSCLMASTVICLATCRKFNFLKYIFDSMIIKLKKRVKKLEKQRTSKPSGLKRLRKVGRMIKVIDADEEITLVDMKTQADLGTELQGRKDDDNATIKEASVSEPTIFDDEEVTMTMAQTLIKMKAKKTRILDEQLAKREYNKVQKFLKPDRDEEPTKKKVAKETLLQESFKKLKAVEVPGSHSTQDTPTDDPKEMSEEDVKNMLEIVPVSKFKIMLLSKADTAAEETKEITLRTTSEAMDVGNFSKLMLGQGELRCIGAITLNEYINYIRKVA